MDPLVVDPPTFAAGDHSGASPAPTRTGEREGTQPGPQFQLVIRWSGGCAALGGPMLADDATGVTLRDPEPIDERVDSSPTTVRG